MIKIGKSLAVFLLIFFSWMVFADDLKIEVKPSTHEISLNDSFQLTVTVQSQSSLDDVELNIPDFNFFEVIKSDGPMSSQQSRMVITPQGQEFQSSYTSTVILTLTPKKLGEFLFPSFTVKRGTESFKSETFKVKVLAVGAKPARPQMQQEEDPFSQMEDFEDQLMKQLIQQRQRAFGQRDPINPPGMLNPQFKNIPTNLKEAFFVQVEVDKLEVYEGEQVTANWYLYTRGQLETLDRLKFPNLKGFWKEIIEEAPSVQFFDEIVNGVSFKKTLLASHALFPIKAGTSTIDEYKIKSRVRLPAPGLSGYYGNAYEYTKSSPAVPIKVKPLPKEGRPSHFTGAVGKFEVSLQLESQEAILMNQPFQVRLRIEGSGNAKVIELPPMNLPDSLELYESKSEAKYFKDGRSYKEFILLFIPRVEGAIEIPPIRFSMFNPENSKYYEKETAAVKINVINNPNAPQANAVNSNSPPVDPSTEKNKDLGNLGSQAPKLDVILSWQESYFTSMAQVYQLWGFVFALGSLGLLFRFLILFGYFKSKRTEKDFLLKRLNQVMKLLSKGSYRNAAIEVINIYYQSLALVSDLESQSQNLEGLLERVSPSLRREYGPRIQENFSKFQALGFAPEESLGALKQPAEIKKNLSEAQTLIRKILDSAKS
ncbi:MAG TPA: BatD family protein [Pseudobdellovibrionaceae bacterium]|nr:BatD family protein [Pseudobdellovibrionaceae bacterium]